MDRFRRTPRTRRCVARFCLTLGFDGVALRIGKTIRGAFTMPEQHVRRFCAYVAAALFVALLVVGLSALASSPSRFDDGVLLLQFETKLGVISGTGVAITPRTILTAAHVVELTQGNGPPRALDISSMSVKQMLGNVMWLTSRFDAAVVRADRDLPVTRTLDCRQAVPGEPITIVGYPSVAGSQIAGPMITQGAVASFMRFDTDYAEFVILDAKVEPGNSGGPVFDQRGRIIGIVVATYGTSIDVPPFSNKPAKHYFVSNGYSIMVPSSTLCRLLGRA